MIILLATAIATATTNEPAPTEAPTADAPMEWPEVVAVQAIFDDIPEKRLRLKAIRYAMRKQPALIGGSDWGRVVCFRFREVRDLEIVSKSLEKVGLEAEVREADNCEVPPKEAFLPPKAKASRLVKLAGEPFDEVLAAEFGALLDLDLGMSAVRIQQGVADRVCLEFDREPDDEAVRFALDALTIEIDRTEPVMDCAIALEPR